MSHNAFDNAMQILAMRDHSCREIELKLQKKGHEEEEVQAAITKLLEYGYLNDQRFTEMYIQSKAQRHYGPFRIRQELSRKGIGSTLTSDTMNSMEIDWFQFAYEAKCRKFGLKCEIDYSRKSKQMRYLQNRGYGFDEIRFAVEHCEDAD